MYVQQLSPLGYAGIILLCVVSPVLGFSCFNSMQEMAQLMVEGRGYLAKQAAPSWFLLYLLMAIPPLGLSLVIIGREFHKVG